MLNISRQIDVLFFHLPKPVVFGDITIQSGFNFIKRDGDKYNVFSFDGAKDSYAYILLDEMPALLHNVFAHLLYPEQAEEEVVVPYHQHNVKPKLRRVG